MKPLSHPFDDAQCARLPAAALKALAPLRCEPGIEVALLEQHAYVCWRPGDEQVIRVLFSSPGCEFFVRRGEYWHRKGHALPELDFPQGLQYLPLYQVLFPVPLAPIAAAAPELAPCPVRLIADQSPRPTTALRCSLPEFAAWAEQVPGCALELLRAAIDDTRIFVLGNKVPWIAAGPYERFWGHRVLAPIGFRYSPLLTEAELRTRADVQDDELLVLHHDGWEVIDSELFSPLSHAALRLAMVHCHT